MTFLTASSLDMVDKPRAEVEFQRARDYAETLPEPARTLMTHVNDRAVDKLGPGAAARRRSRSRSARNTWRCRPSARPPPSAPVFLLHGAEDNVIPSVETVLLTNTVAARPRCTPC